MVNKRNGPHSHTYPAYVDVLGLQDKYLIGMTCHLPVCFSSKIERSIIIKKEQVVGAGRPPLSSMHDAVVAAKLIAAAYASVEKRREVLLSEIN